MAEELTTPTDTVAEHNDDRRSAEIVTNVGAVRARIASACAAVGRDPQEVTLVAVTKTRPARDVATLARIGVLDIGENKDQEARGKIDELATLPTPPRGVRWHMVGRLQSNKARSVAGYAHAVHSLDRPKIARALDAAIGELRGDDRLDVFVQVSLDDDPARGGVPVGELERLVDTVGGLAHLRLCGLMAVPPADAEPRASFARLRELSEQVRAAHPDAVSISAGMSGDLEAAIENGSTHVRVGSALLGRRDQVFS